MPHVLTLTSKGLDYLLADEIKQLCGDIPLQMGVNSVSFDGEIEAVYKLCLHSNLASKVLWHLVSGDISSDRDLYQLVQQIDWATHLKANGSLAVDFVGTNKVIRNTQYGAVKVKDAIVDQFWEEQSIRPDVEKFQPDIRIHVRLKQGKASIYLDLSGAGLHQRGYRSETGDAPLKEHIACAMLIRSGWLEHTDLPLYDPFCGSGTILIEAVRMAKEIAPGLARQYWGFQGWLRHQPNIWKGLVEQAEANQKNDINLSVSGSDIDKRVLNKARENISIAGFQQDISLSQQNAEKTASPNIQAGYIVSNPPYGERMGSMPELLQLYRNLGNNFKTHFALWHLALLCSDTGLLKQLKLGYKKQYKINNGSIECVFNTYQVNENEKLHNADIANSVIANRISKNLKGLKNWLRQHQVDCFRVYDADIPEFNVAIDVYSSPQQSYVVIYEYAAPKDIPEQTAKSRLQEVVMAVPGVLDVAPENIVLKVREKQKGRAQYQKLNKKRQRLVVKEGNAKFLINLWDYLDTGLFLDHRRTRELVAAKSQGKRVLNLFAYTGAVSVQAALAGAETVTTVDMSKTYLQWAQDNFKQNRLTGKQYRFEQADCIQWLTRANEKFDLIFIDPPTFSNSKRMEATFDVQRDYIQLLSDARKLMADNATIIFTNNKRHFKMDHSALDTLSLQAKNISSQTLPKDFARNPHIHNSWEITQKA